MSNVKQISIRAIVPFDYLDSDRFGDPGMSDEDAAFLARLFLAPAMGLKCEARYAQGKTLANGGYLTQYELVITGREALRFETIEHLIEILDQVGNVETAWALDVEDTSSQPIVFAGGGAPEPDCDPSDDEIAARGMG